MKTTHKTNKMTNRTKIVALAAGLILATTLASTSVSAQTVIQGATVHTVSGEALEGASVVIGVDGTIVAVGTDVEIPDGATVIDASGKVVTPGFIDAWTSLGLVEIGAVSQSNDSSPEDLDGDRIMAALRAADAVNTNSAVIPIQRTGGVTSVVTVPGRGIVTGQSAWLDLAGAKSDTAVDASTDAPTADRTTAPTNATIVAPMVALHASATEWSVAAAGASRAALWLTFRELLDDSAYYMANQEAFDQNRSRALDASRLDLAAFGRVLSGELPLILAADRATDIRTAVALAKEKNFRLVIAGGAEAWMVADLLASEKVPVIVEPLENLPFSFGRLGARADNAVILHNAGVKVLISTYDAHNVRNLRQLAGNAVRAGLAHDVALHSVTLAPAEALGMADRYGSLEPGKVANVVIWSADPFEHSTRVEALFVGGVPTSLTNRQQKLFERYRSLERRGEPLDYPRPAPKQDTEDEED